MASSETMTDTEKMRQPWTLLSSKAKVDEKIKEHKDKLVVIFFNLKTMPRFSVEQTLKEQRYKYDGTEFFKCNVIEISDKIATDFNVTEIPTFIFYRDEKMCETLTKPSAEKLTEVLDRWSKQKPEQQSQNS